MIPADFYVFVETKPKSDIFLLEQGDVLGVVTRVGKRCHEQEVLIKKPEGLEFGRLNEGDQISFRNESIYWTFQKDGKPVNCLSIKDVKCCYHQ